MVNDMQYSSPIRLWQTSPECMVLNTRYRIPSGIKAHNDRGSQYDTTALSGIKALNTRGYKIDRMVQGGA